MRPLDAVLWALVALLFGMAAWWQLRGEPPWDPARFFVACWRARLGAAPPLTPREPADDTPLSQLPEPLQPQVRLGAGLAWDSLDSPAGASARARRLADTVLIWIEPPPLGIPDLQSVTVELPDPPPPEVTAEEAAWADAAVERFAACLPTPQARVVAAAHVRAQDLLRLLRLAPGLRDRLRAVLLVGASYDRDWLLRHFNHVDMDVEVLREVPWLQLREPGGTALPEPPEPPSARRCLTTIDLGETNERQHPALQGALADLLAALS